MVLVDTSVWVKHLRHGSEELSSLLENSQVYCHPFIIGELACGNLKNRQAILELLASLPQTVVLEQDEVLDFIAANRLYGRGLSWIDVHLLSASLLSGTALWTLDERLRKAAIKFNLA